MQAEADFRNIQIVNIDEVAAPRTKEKARAESRTRLARDSYGCSGIDMGGLTRGSGTSMLRENAPDERSAVADTTSLGLGKPFGTLARNARGRPAAYCLQHLVS